MANTYTIQSTNKYDAVLARLVASENAKLAAQTPPGTSWTAESYLQARAKDMLDSWSAQQQADDTAPVHTALASATPAQIAAAKAALGL